MISSSSNATSFPFAAMIELMLPDFEELLVLFVAFLLDVFQLGRYSIIAI